MPRTPSACLYDVASFANIWFRPYILLGAFQKHSVKLAWYRWFIRLCFCMFKLQLLIIPTMLYCRLRVCTVCFILKNDWILYASCGCETSCLAKSVFCGLVQLLSVSVKALQVDVESSAGWYDQKCILFHWIWLYIFFHAYSGVHSIFHWLREELLAPFS